MDYGKFIQGEIKQALQVLDPKDQADMNRMVQKIGAVMGNDKLTGKQKTDEVLLIQKEMQEKHADTSNR